MTAPTTHLSTTGRLHTGTVDGCGACGVAGIMPVADFRLLEHQVLTGCGFHALYGDDCAICGDGEGENASLRPVAAPLAPEQAQRTVRDPHDAQEGAQ